MYTFCRIIRNFIKKSFPAWSLILLCSLMVSCAPSERQESVRYISEKYRVPEEKQLIVYTSHKEEVYLPIIREFENRTGIWVEVHTGGSAELFEDVRDHYEEGCCDVLFGGGIESYEAAKDLFLPYRPEGYDALDQGYLSSGGEWTPFTELPLVMIYNKKLVSGADAPKTWSDLLSPEWKGKIAFADLHSSGTSYTILSTMLQVTGKAPTDLMDAFCTQLEGESLSSSGEVIPQVSEGTYPVGITLEETARKGISSGYDIAIVYPEDGTSTIPDGCAIVKNAPHSYNAGRFLDFVISTDVQKYAMEHYFRRPVRTDVPLISSLQEFSRIDFDLETSALQEEEVFSLWDQRMSLPSEKEVP